MVAQSRLCSVKVLGSPENTHDAGSELHFEACRKYAPVADAGRLCDPLVPAEAGSTHAQRVGEMARGEWPGLLGVGLGIVAQAQLYRIESEGVGQLVHCAFEG